MRRTVLHPLVAAFVFLATAAHAATTTIDAAKDNTIFQSNSNNSAGGAAGIRAGTNGSGSPRRGLIAFDIASNVPAGSIITGVQLTLYVGDTPTVGYYDVGLHKLTKDWGEGSAGNSEPALSGTGMGSPASPGDATWSHAMLGSASWTNAGALGDFNAVASATTSVGGPVDSPINWTSTSALVADVQSWLDTSATNFGWALINAHEETIRSQNVFYSREATQNSSELPNSLDPTWRPSLTITYVESPSPSGDYNGNGVVDAADYVVWRETLNMSANPAGSGADGNKSGMIDPGDYTYWRARFGNPVSGFAAGANVPEPAGVTTCLFVAMLAYLRRRR
jgi:hypothetical protein